MYALHICRGSRNTVLCFLFSSDKDNYLVCLYPYTFI